MTKKREFIYIHNSVTEFVAQNLLEQVLSNLDIQFVEV